MKRKKRRNRGFTLIEIMIVLGIMAMLFSFVGVQVVEKWRESQIKGAQIQIASYEQALQAFFLDCNFYPNTAQGLDALNSKPGVGRECKRYASQGYLKKKVAEDPWGQPYRYVCDDYQSYVISSDGPDGEEGTEDDITSDT